MRKEAVFVHKVNIGGRSPQKAKQMLEEYIEQYSVKLKSVNSKNIFIPVKDESGSVTCIYQTLQ